MEIKKPKIKSMQYEDFKDNEYLEAMVKELNANGTNVIVGCLDDLINWDAAILCGRLLLPQVVAESSLCRLVPRVMILPVSGLK